MMRIYLPTNPCDIHLKEPKFDGFKLWVTNFGNSTIVELHKDIFRVCQKIKTCLHFMYIAGTLNSAPRTGLDDIINFFSLVKL
jgi:hypothetical protein